MKNTKRLYAILMVVTLLVFNTVASVTAYASEDEKICADNLQEESIVSPEFSSTYTPSQYLDVHNLDNSGYPQVMKSEEIEEFLKTASPVPVPKPTAQTFSTSVHNGSYSHDVETGTTTFEPFEFTSSRCTEKESPGYFPNDYILIPEPRGIIDGDNRVKISNTTVGPWCNTVKLIIVAGNGANYIGSGFMIGPNSVATAGHCLYNSETGGWAKSITVIPALNGSYQPYGSASSYDFICGGNWVNSNDNQDDWGIIRIKANLGYSTGWLGLRWQSSSYNDESVYAVGYPGEDDSHMYYGPGTVTSSSDRTLVGNWDLTGGQSGGPVHKYYSSTGYTAIGINRGGGSTYSDCLRIDEWLFNKFMSYRTLSY